MSSILQLTMARLFTKLTVSYHIIQTQTSLYIQFYHEEIVDNWYHECTPQLYESTESDCGMQNRCSI